MGDKTRKPYTRQSIDRALQHHELRGTIRTWSPPEQPGPNARSKYRVTLHDQERVELSERETWILCLALAAAETREHRVHPGSASGPSARMDPELSP